VEPAAVVEGADLSSLDLEPVFLIHLYCDVILAYDDQPEPLEAIETLGAGNQPPQERTTDSHSVKPVVDSQEQGSSMGARATVRRENAYADWNVPADRDQLGRSRRQDVEPRLDLGAFRKRVAAQAVAAPGLI